MHITFEIVLEQRRKNIFHIHMIPKKKVLEILKIWIFLYIDLDLILFVRDFLIRDERLLSCYCNGFYL